ncbi:hypothetical protein NSDW_11700 [Novosphingobium olei]|nr:hypothetical protein NSDW_11700 [Novosphingobium olei]
MKTITLTKKWTYLSPMLTVEFGPGEHEVDDAIAAAHEKESTNGSRTAKARAPRAADKAQG